MNVAGDFTAKGAKDSQRKAKESKDPSIQFVQDEGHFHLYFETDDIAAAAAGLKANGVPIVSDVHDTPWGTRELVINDDQRHTLYFGESIAET